MSANGNQSYQQAQYTSDWLNTGATYPNDDAYPSSGAFQHLPVRVTITGEPALAHPNANKIFLRDLPAHCYILPNVTLNFTLVEIIVLLPNWFKNKAICHRFLNNNLTTNVHLAILEDHRELTLATKYDREKARKTLADEYRKTMRKINSGWTKTKYVAPLGWNPSLIAVDGFVPDDVSLEGYRRPPSIPFKDLAIGVKKLPEGTCAGDLTRALNFALESELVYHFPDDLAAILDYIGRTETTSEHTDRPVVNRYSEFKRIEEDARRYPRQQQSKSNKKTDVRSFPAPQTQTIVVREQAVREPAVWGPGNPALAETSSQFADLRVPASYQPAKSIMPLRPQDRVINHQMQGDQSNQDDHSSEEMEALLGPHLVSQAMTTPVSPGYAPDYLLRDCIEGDIAFDGTPLARAARFAQRQDQLTANWTMSQVAWLNNLLDAALAETSIWE